MKKQLIAALLTLTASFSLQAQVILSDSFSYPDGSIITNSSGVWSNHSGTIGQTLVSGGKLLLTQSASEDINTTFTGAGTVIYTSFKVNFSAIPSTSGDYFAHFKDNTTTNYRGRVFATATNALPGTFRLGISAAAGSPNQILPRDLTTNTEYVVVFSYDTVNFFGTLWVNPISQSDLSVATSDVTSAVVLSAFAFRQSSGIGSMSIDDLKIGNSFADVVTAPFAPTVVLQPVGKSVFSGENVMFYGVANGSGQLFYQWRFNNANLPGETSNVLSLISVSSASQGNYSLLVSNAISSAISSNAFLSVNTTPTAPFFTAQPKSQTVNVGLTATFTAAASGTYPLNYQWYFNGSPLSGQTATNLVLTAVQTNQAGNYSVSVSNSVNGIISSNAVLTVVVPVPVVTNIAYLRTLMTPDFAPADTTTIFTVEGIVTTYTNLTSAGNAQFYIMDNTAGIAVFVSGGSTIRPLAGDKVRVTGPLGAFNGLFELNLVASNPNHSVTILSSGNPLPTPAVFNFSTASNPSVMEASVEGSRLVISNVFLGGGTTFLSGENVNMTNQSGQVFLLRIDTRVGDVIGKPKPEFAYSITGVMGQFDNATPFDSGYQFFVTRYADIITNAPPAAVRLSIAKSGSDVLVSWPTSATGFVLQGNPV
ncbi:MAG: immunoglobulin domain-containing protein, partial [Limisphaerales bacterium]